MANPSESFFKSSVDRSAWWIVFAAILFHLAIAGIIYGVNKIKIVKEPEMIPVFELVNVAAPAPVPAPPPPPKAAPEPPRPPEPAPPKQQPKVAPKPTPKPVVKPELPPEPKIAPKEEPPKEVVKEEPVPEPVEEVAEVKEETPPPPPAPQNDFDIDDMELPKTFEKSSLATVGSVNMDPLLQAFLERLKQLVMQNFNPPNGLTIPRDAKTTVQFIVNSDGSIDGVTLKKSSGNKTWDALSMRAVQITKGPGLPQTYKADALSLQFNFTPN